ncbi:MAG TPA: SPOR domain-containing protein [Gemmatimonadales bacterium]|nr:SPOR domain-containing protein [Gemmatimonadales bacterium]
MADITHDLTDDGFHEIQLSGKQLVFLFMATTAVSVMIFLLGVLVGRDVRGGKLAEPTEAALTTPAPVPSPAPDPVKQQAAAQPAPTAEPPSPPADDELTYRKRLESDSAAKETLKPQGTSARSDAAPEPARSEASVPAPEPLAKAAPAKAAAAAATPAAGAAGRPGRWVVQLVALRDRSAAASIVQRLSGRGFPAFIVNPASSTPNQVYKVQVGRYDDKTEAERVAKRLEKEEKFSPWISR